MNNNISYAFDNSSHLAGAVLSITSDSKSTSIDFSEFLLDDFPRKTILNIEHVNSLSNSSINYKINAGEPKVIKKITIKKDSLVTFKTLSSEEKINFNFHSELIELNVFCFLDTPIIAQNIHDSEKQILIKNSQILNVFFVFSESNNSSVNFIDNHSIFESYGELGFLICDLNSINSFIKNHDSKIGNDLIEEFTTTELAGELFDNGLIMLCWGITPWVYYINSEGKNSNSQTLPMGEKTRLTGSYKLSEDISKFSIIPGNALRDWSSCMNNDWPEIIIEGDGGIALLELYILNALSENGSIPIPTFFIQRSSDPSIKLEPLLHANIFSDNF